MHYVRITYFMPFYFQSIFIWRILDRFQPYIVMECVWWLSDVKMVSKPFKARMRSKNWMIESICDTNWFKREQNIALANYMTF